MDGDRSTEILNMVTALTNKLNTMEDKLDYLQRAFDEFRSETRSNFERMRTDMRQTQEMIGELGGDIVKIRGPLRDHEKRITAIESEAA